MLTGGFFFVPKTHRTNYQAGPFLMDLRVASIFGSLFLRGARGGERERTKYCILYSSKFDLSIKS